MTLLGVISNIAIRPLARSLSKPTFQSDFICVAYGKPLRVYICVHLWFQILNSYCEQEVY